MAARWKQVRPWVLRCGGVLLLVAVVDGFRRLDGLLGPELSLVIRIGAVLLVLLRAAAQLLDERWVDVASRWALGVVVPILSLLSVAGAWAKWIDPRPGPLLGLAAASVVIGLTVWIYLETWWTPDNAKRPAFWALFCVWWLVIAPPILVWSTGRLKDAGWRTGFLLAAVVAAVALVAYRKLEHRRPRPGRPTTRPRRWRTTGAGMAVVFAVLAFGLVYGSLHEGAGLSHEQAKVSVLDVVVVNGADDTAVSAPEGISHGWDAMYWNGRAPGGAQTVDWAEPGAPPPSGREGADRVLVLLPDGVRPGSTTADLGDEDRWLAIAARYGPRVPAYILLRGDEARAAAWRARLKKGSPVRVVSLGSERGDIRSVVFRLAITSPASNDDLALAYQHRPALLFARGEQYPTPLNADWLLESGAMEICPNTQPTATPCHDVHSYLDLTNDDNHLRFKTRNLRFTRADSTIYVHVVRSGAYTYLDYWWYLPDNPVGAAGGALCGLGFVIPDVTCHDHPSDWEGLTVLLHADPATGVPEPVAVHYPAHSGRVRYDWATLQRIWAQMRNSKGKPYVPHPPVDTSQHPLVFIARGTHADYPDICDKAHCNANTELSDNIHDGSRPWFGNVDRNPDCPTLCVAALPTDRLGKPSRWNAYDGVWGVAHCQLIFYCNEITGPPSPGRQGRYRDPSCATHWGEWDSRRRKAIVHKERRCTPPR